MPEWRHLRPQGLEGAKTGIGMWGSSGVASWSGCRLALALRRHSFTYSGWRLAWTPAWTWASVAGSCFPHPLTPCPTSR